MKSFLDGMMGTISNGNPLPRCLFELVRLELRCSWKESVNALGRSTGIFDIPLKDTFSFFLIFPRNKEILRSSDCITRKNTRAIMW